MNEDETITFEDRSYVNPQVSLAEQDQFLERFKDIQSQNQAQINQQTQALGSQVPSNQGGLVGAEGLWNVQYQRPQVNAAIENLRQSNQLQALNTVMSNEQNAMTNRLNQVKRAYYRALQEQNKRDRDKTNSSNSSNSPKGDVDLITSDTIAANLKDVPQDNFFYKLVNSNDTIPGYAPGVSAITGATEAERRLKAIAQIIANRQKKAS